MRNAIPKATIESTWRLRSAWAATARLGKQAQSRARLGALALGVLGAVLGAVAGQGVAQTLASMLPLVAAVAVALAAYFGRELLIEERETRWARARILAEALQRECWKCLLGVRPYDTDEAGELLAGRAAALGSNAGLDRVPVGPADAGNIPETATVEVYVQQRALAQMQWYENRSALHLAKLRRLRTLSFLAGALAVVLGAAGTTFADALGYVPVATTVATAVAAWMQASRVGSMATLYQEAAAQLRLRLAVWADGAARRAVLPADVRAVEEAELVETCESIIARENDSWRAEWLSEERVEEAIAALERAQSAADTAVPNAGR